MYRSAISFYAVDKCIIGVATLSHPSYVGLFFIHSAPFRKYSIGLNVPSTMLCCIVACLCLNM